MTKKVFIKIVGSQPGTEEEPVSMSACGIYHLTNGKHYIQYDEKSEDDKVVLNNIIKISEERILLTKKGAQNSQMDFDLSAATQTIYQTPYGNLPLDIMTKSIIINETAEKMVVELKYALFSNESQLSDNKLVIIVEACE